MRLHSITLKNFRAFKNETFEFKPFTLLTGPNSSGKSTVIKALMLLQENLAAPNYLGTLNFKSGEHRLGNYDKVIHRNNDSKSDNNDIDRSSKVFKSDYQITLGGRYMLKEKIGFFFEFGKATTNVQLGLAFKL